MAVIYKILISVLFLVIILFIPLSPLGSEDYQYQYYKGKGKTHTPFSDYIPKVRLHYKTVPHYLEDYYELYGMKLYYNENTLRKNISRLKTALACKFRHPSMALVKVTTEEEYRKYRNLMFMHINILIMRSHLKIGARYDKRRIYFFNLDYAKEISESLDIARQYYKESLPYWEKAQQYARKASEIKITTDLGFIESERYSIIRGELDYGKIISGYLKKVETKKNKLTDVVSKLSP